MAIHVSGLRIFKIQCELKQSAFFFKQGENTGILLLQLERGGGGCSGRHETAQKRKNLTVISYSLIRRKVAAGTGREDETKIPL